MLAGRGCTRGKGLTEVALFHFCIGSKLILVLSLKESQQKENEASNKRSLLSLGHLKDSLYTCFVNRSPKERCRIILLLAMAFIVLIISSGDIGKFEYLVKENFIIMSWDTPKVEN